MFFCLVERTALQPPRPCFGLEQTKDNPLCPECPHRQECAEFMGHLVNRVYVDEVTFQFMPSALAAHRVKTDVPDPDSEHIEAVYSFCYEWVFGQKARGNIFKHKNTILQRVRESGTSVKMFFLANMLGWKKTHPETPFFPTPLIDDFAVKQVKVFSETCQHQYGAFDVTGLDRLMGSKVAKEDFETNLLNSEIVAGAWIINYKLFKTGNMLNRLYAEKELALNPYWLAIEQSYYDRVLAPHQENRDLECSDLVCKHRWQTIQIIGKLKRNQRQAIAVFSARERIMPEALRRVLGQRGLRPEHFQSEDVPVVSAIKFWIRLAAAIHHYECIKFVDNVSSIFDIYR